MNDLTEAKTKQTNKNQRTSLPVIFFNKDGEPEPERMPVFSITFGVDTPPFTKRHDTSSNPASIEMTEAAASSRLRRALFETGQLCVTPKDGLSRVCFAGVGDPARLLVESVERDMPVPTSDYDFNGCLCSLAQAEAILRRIYRGESSKKLATSLSTLVLGRRKQRVPASRRLRAA